jgi:tRNA-uridine 2-sulfurtransferase|tara:strand:+ start:691 stop:1821 length:1131 start_codon:yes stop_codon:yes gene_type:complete
MKKEKVLVAMSGGVDSAVSAALLHEQGYDVIGVTLRLYTPDVTDGLSSKRNCCGIEEVSDAKKVTAKLDIPHYVINMEKEFEEKVINVFANEYVNGRTPNPCLNCNKHIKFDTLLNQAQAMGIPYLATGHYATIKEDQGALKLYSANDNTKDQSYVLYSLSQQQLQHILFPLGEIHKRETRNIAAKLGFSVADKPDSVDICFVTENNYADFLQKKGIQFKPGEVINKEGQEIGTHAGIPSYTIGQRRGINYNLHNQQQPQYINSFDLTKNQITVGDKEDLQINTIYLEDINWVNDKPRATESLVCRVRYNGQHEQCSVIHESNKTTIILNNPVTKPSNGQSCVIYRGNPQQQGEVVGGGIITNCILQKRKTHIKHD